MLVRWWIFSWYIKKEAAEIEDSLQKNQKTGVERWEWGQIWASNESVGVVVTSYFHCFEHFFDKKSKEDQRKVENILNNLYLRRLNFFLSTPTWLANFDHHSQIVHEKVFNFQSFAQRYDEWERWVKLKNSCSKTGHISLLLLLFDSLCDATNISHSLVCMYMKNKINHHQQWWILDSLKATVIEPKSAWKWTQCFSSNAKAFS